MVKAALDVRTRAVLLYEEEVLSAGELSSRYGISVRTLRRWRKAYACLGVEGLMPLKPGPKEASHAVSSVLEKRILRLKQKHPSWGARRIKYQYGLPVHWKTVHNVIKRNGLLVRIKAKPQPSKRFQRRHVDSLWQGDTFQFRISGVGKVYVTGFTDDRSRYRIVSKTYLRKGENESINALVWALRKGRRPKQVYLDNGKQFIAKEFKAKAKEQGIKLIYGRPHNPRGRGKIESYHKTLYRELISQKHFASLSHFRKELWKFDQRYNNWRRQEIHGWQTPADIYNDPRYFNKDTKELTKSGH